MSVAPTFLNVLQIGQETTKGTAVVATNKLLVDTFKAWLPDDIYTPDQQRGLLMDAHAGILTSKKVQWELEAPYSHEQSVYFFNMALKKQLTGTGAGADKTFTFAPSVSGADDFLTATFQFRHSDGTNNVDRSYPYSMAQTLEISGTFGGPTMVKMGGFAKTEAGVFTAAIALPTVAEYPAAGIWKLFSDSSWANLGTTQVTGQLYAFSWKLTTGLNPAFYIDGNLEMTRHRRVKRMVELTLSLDHEMSSGLLETFRTRKRSRALSYLQLESLGSTLGSGTYKTELDGAYTVEEVPGEEDHEGEQSATVKLRSKYDATGAQDIRAVVVTNATPVL